MTGVPREICVGEAVQLTSGGFAMTVERIDGDVAYCVWADKSGRVRRDALELRLLRHDRSDTHATIIIEGYGATSDDIADYRRAAGLGNA